jgi:AraC-like DNA-binding protein
LNDPALSPAAPDAKPDRAAFHAETPGIERAEIFLARRAFAPHRHDTYALGMTVSGIQKFGYRGAGRQACTGDVFVLHPDERHDGRPGTADGFGYRVLYVAPELIGHCLGRRTLPFVPDPVPRHPGLRAAIRRAVTDPTAMTDALGRMEMIAELAEALADAAGPATRTVRSLDTAAVARVKARLRQSCISGVDMAELERESGLDRWSLYRQFRAAYGVSPGRFLTLRRLDLARRLIAEGQSLADAALGAGFADQSHMNRQFRAAVGLPPGAWRRLLHRAPPSDKGRLGPVSSADPVRSGP